MPTTIPSNVAIGAAAFVQLPREQVERMRQTRVRVGDMIRTTYTFTDGEGGAYKASIEVKVHDPFELFGKDASVPDALAILVRQCVEARLE